MDIICKWQNSNGGGGVIPGHVGLGLLLINSGLKIEMGKKIQKAIHFIFSLKIQTVQYSFPKLHFFQIIVYFF